MCLRGSSMELLDEVNERLKRKVGRLIGLLSFDCGVEEAVPSELRLVVLSGLVFWIASISCFVPPSGRTPWTFADVDDVERAIGNILVGFWKGDTSKAVWCKLFENHKYELLLLKDRFESYSLKSSKLSCWNYNDWKFVLFDWLTSTLSCSLTSNVVPCTMIVER